MVGVIISIVVVGSAAFYAGYQHGRLIEARQLEELLFKKEYRADFSATKAAIRAGYSKD